MYCFENNFFINDSRTFEILPRTKNNPRRKTRGLRKKHKKLALIKHLKVIIIYILKCEFCASLSLYWGTDNIVE